MAHSMTLRICVKRSPVPKTEGNYQESVGNVLVP